MKGIDGLQYTQEGNLNRYLFYSDLNYINIFVEDENKEYEYETIFKRMLEPECKISAIFPTGGKSQLINVYNYLKYQNMDFTNCIFIADGDFDRIIGTNIINDLHFIYLDYYCIENYYVDKNSTILFLKGRLKKTDNEVANLIRFDDWLIAITSQLYKLFLLYCVVQKYKPEIKNVSRGPNMFLNNKNGLERTGAYDEYYNQIKLEIDDLDIKLSEMDNAIYELYNTNYFSVICGKHLLDSLCKHLRGLTKCVFSNIDFRWFLICNFDISKLDYLRDRIDRIVHRIQ